MHTLLECHRILPFRFVATEPLVTSGFSFVLNLRLFPGPKQLHPKSTPTDDMHARCRGIGIYVLHPHRAVFTITIAPHPRLNHLLRLPYTLLPHHGITLLVETPASDFSVVTPCRTLGGDDVGAELLDDAVVFNGLHPVGATGGDLVDDGGRGVCQIQAPGGDDEEGVAVFGEEGVARVVGPDWIEDSMGREKYQVR